MRSRLLGGVSSCLGTGCFEVIFVPQFEAFNELLLGVVDGVGSESCVTFKLFQLLEGLSVVALECLQLLDLVQFFLIDHLVLVTTVGIINEALSAGVNVRVHGAVDGTLLAGILLLLHKLASIINLPLEQVARVSLRFYVKSSFEEVSTALNNGLLNFFALFKALVLQEGGLLVDRLSLLLVLGSVAHRHDHLLLLLLLDQFVLSVNSIFVLVHHSDLSFSLFRHFDLVHRSGVKASFTQSEFPGFLHVTNSVLLHLHGFLLGQAGNTATSTFDGVGVLQNVVRLLDHLVEEITHLQEVLIDNSSRPQALDVLQTSVQVSLSCLLDLILFLR